MFYEKRAANADGSPLENLRRIWRFSVALAAISVPQSLAAQTLPNWSGLQPVEPPAIVALNSATPMASVLSYKNPLAPWAGASAVVASSRETNGLVPELKEWTEEKLSGARAAERTRRRLEIAAFYEARGAGPLWLDGKNFTVAALSALGVLREADQDGLNLTQTPPPSDNGGWTGMRAELALSEAIADYAAQAAGERVDPKAISKLLGQRPTLPQTAQVLADVSAAGSEAGAILQKFNPQHDGYRALKEKLAELRMMRISSAQPAVTRVADAHLSATDATARPSSNLLAQGDARATEAEIIANMERWRWMPRDLGADRIEVNIPDFTLSLKRHGAVAHRTRVIVGKTTTPTPVFSDRMRFIVVNPSWSVPPSIIRKEMAAKHGGDLSYLAARGFQVSYHNGRASVRQPPGERNALGRVKFVFPNEYSVYLHDTPTRNLFSQSRRAFSHGCVRVDQPFKLAEAVLAQEGDWPESRLRRMIGPSERRIDLSEALPVHIEYFTAFVDEDGRLQLRDDIYGYSAKTRAALKLNGA